MGDGGADTGAVYIRVTGEKENDHAATMFLSVDDRLDGAGIGNGADPVG